MNTLWNEVLLKTLMERFSPVVMKLLTDPRVQSLLAEILNLQSGLRENIEGQVKTMARTLDLATRDEVTGVRDVVKALEAQVAELKKALDEKNAKLKKQDEAIDTLKTEVEKAKATAEDAAKKASEKPKTTAKKKAATKKAEETQKTTTKKTATKKTTTKKAKN